MSARCPYNARVSRTRVPLDKDAGIEDDALDNGAVINEEEEGDANGAVRPLCRSGLATPSSCAGQSGSEAADTQRTRRRCRGIGVATTPVSAAHATALLERVWELLSVYTRARLTDGLTDAGRRGLDERPGLAASR